MWPARRQNPWPRSPIFAEFCEEHLPKGSAIEIIDLAINPEFAARDQIVALPTLIRRRPEPIKRLIGTLADTQKVLDGLELKASAA